MLIGPGTNRPASRRCIAGDRLVGKQFVRERTRLSGIYQGMGPCLRRGSAAGGPRRLVRGRGQPPPQFKGGIPHRVRRLESQFGDRKLNVAANPAKQGPHGSPNPFAEAARNLCAAPSYSGRDLAAAERRYKQRPLIVRPRAPGHKSRVLAMRAVIAALAQSSNAEKVPSMRRHSRTISRLTCGASLRL